MNGIYFTFLAGFTFAVSTSLAEEKCAKFEYEYKVLERIVELEHDHKGIKKMADKIQQLEDVHHETAKILQSQAKIIKQQENNITALHKKHGTDIKEVMTDIDEVRKNAETSVSRQNRVIQELKTTHASNIEGLRKLAEFAGGSKSTYTRWGRSDCPSNGTELIYDGYMGGSMYHHKGGAANFVCLTKQPLWNHVQSGRQNDAYMYGTEYEFYGHSGYGKEFFGMDLRHHNAPCAICGTTRSTVIMVPGRNKCLNGWTLEYHGYLATNRHTHYTSVEYICVDHSVTTVSGSKAVDDNGALLYLVEAICGSLKCPPYVDGAEVTCAVCSK